MDSYNLQKQLRNRTLPTYLSILLVIFITGCASIFSGTKQEVTFTSTPDGALVTIQGKPMGRTPLTILTAKEKKRTAVIEKEGYRSATIDLTNEVDPLFYVNILGFPVGMIFSSITDAASGAIYKYAPDKWHVTLQPLEQSKIEFPTRIAERDKVKSYIFLFYSAIQAEAAKGGGSHVTSLLELLGVPKVEEQVAVAKLQALSAASVEPDLFGDQVLDAFAAPASPPPNAPIVAPAATPEKIEGIRVALFPVEVPGGSIQQAWWVLDAAIDGVKRTENFRIAYTWYPKNSPGVGFNEDRELPNRIRTGMMRSVQTSAVQEKCKALGADVALLIETAGIMGGGSSSGTMKILVIDANTGRIIESTVSFSYNANRNSVISEAIAEALVKVRGVQ